MAATELTQEDAMTEVVLSELKDGIRTITLTVEQDSS